MARMHSEDIEALENATPDERTVLDFSGKRPDRMEHGGLKRFDTNLNI
jgi:hypothetical protein